MKITFLGSSHGVPAADRYCSSLMVEVNEKVYIIDTGAPVIDCLLRHGKTPTDVQAIFYTHGHGDHTSGVFLYLDLLHWYYKNDDVDLYMTEQRIVDGVSGYLKALFGGYAADRIRFHVAPSDFVFDDGNLKITYIPTKHVMGGDRPSYAMLLEADGKKFLMTGDLSQGLKLEDFPQVAFEEELDLIVCEMAHFGVTALTPYLEKLKTKQIWFSHVAPARRFDSIKEIMGKYPYKICIAHDDDVIEL